MSDIREENIHPADRRDTFDAVFAGYTISPPPAAAPISEIHPRRPESLFSEESSLIGMTQLRNQYAGGWKPADHPQMPASAMSGASITAEEGTPHSPNSGPSHPGVISYDNVYVAGNDMPPAETYQSPSMQYGALSESVPFSDGYSASPSQSYADYSNGYDAPLQYEPPRRRPDSPGYIRRDSDAFSTASHPYSASSATSPMMGNRSPPPGAYHHPAYHNQSPQMHQQRPMMPVNYGGPRPPGMYDPRMRPDPRMMGSPPRMSSPPMAGRPMPEGYYRPDPRLMQGYRPRPMGPRPDPRYPSQPRPMNDGYDPRLRMGPDPRMMRPMPRPGPPRPRPGDSPYEIHYRTDQYGNIVPVSSPAQGPPQWAVPPPTMRPGPGTQPRPRPFRPPHPSEGYPPQPPH